jgi:hypothetical protein
MKSVTFSEQFAICEDALDMVGHVESITQNATLDKERLSEHLIRNIKTIAQFLSR